ncbi:hypothetical protein DZC31_26600 [Stenotrophomonas rhizophila]|nr:hypothetical protein DZC31_26600 [Stenotrophomonas rhizophila]
MRTLDGLTLLNLELGFEEWAEKEGFNLECVDGSYVDSRTFDAWRGYLAAHGEHGVAGQQLFAKIKKSSDYAHQTDQLFPVRVGTPPYGDYAVHGGPGGVYRLSDVEFYIIEDGKQYRLK